MAALKYFLCIFLGVVSANNDALCSKKSRTCKECLNYIGCVWCYDETPFGARCMHRNESITCNGSLQDKEDTSVSNLTESRDSYMTLEVNMKLGRMDIPLEYPVLRKMKPSAGGNEILDWSLHHKGSMTIVELVAKECFKDELLTIKDADDNTVIEIISHALCNVPCGCETDMNNSSESLNQCNNRGFIQCGKCICDGLWKGDQCDVDDERGDTLYDSSCRKSDGDKKCSGRGVCKFKKCECNEEVLYPNEFCQNICEYTYDCAECHVNALIKKMNPETNCKSECDSSNNKVSVFSNLTIYEELFPHERYLDLDKVVNCTVVDEYKCSHNYLVRKNGTSSSYVLLQSNSQCGLYLQVFTAGNTLVWLPIVMAATLLTIAVAGAYAYWRHLQSIKGIPSIPEYNKIVDADLRKGENPIYKPPSIRYNNPTFGKC